MRRGKQVCFYILMIVLVCFISYSSIEIAVRIFYLPDRELIRSIEKNLFSLSRIEGYFDWEAPIYGWDQDGINLSSDLSSSMSDIAYTVLFMGDSVTRGYGGRYPQRSLSDTSIQSTSR